ncbi:MAG: flagellar motor switch protein FliG [Spirochaetes bacterium]|nr:flagellar motor switch protein FliG [Spirochaetota bacterium]
MKPIEEMTGIEKAATFLVAIGAEVASRVLAHLDEKTVFKIAQEIVKIEDLSVTQKEDLIGEFLIDLKKSKGAVYGGENVAKGMLIAAFGEEKAENILSNITHIDVEKGFTFLKNIDPDILTSLLENEHPQTITAALYYLSPVQNAKILKNLPTFLSKDIIKRMARLEKPSPGAVLEIVRVLRNKYEKLRTSAIKAEKTDGISTLIDIMSQMDPEQERKLKEYLYLKLPAISDKIREKLFTFEAVLNLTHREVQILIDEINDDYVIAKSLKGAGDALRFKFLRNMSQNRATSILNEMDNIGPVRLSEINEARNSIVQILRFLNDNGSIIVRKDQESLVE